MRLVRVRFSVRRMMLGVAIVGLVLALLAHDQRLRLMAANHKSRAFQLFKPISVTGAGPVGTIQHRVTGQPGTLAYQPTPEGLEQMRIANQYIRKAVKLEKTLAVVLLISIVWGTVEVLAARRRNKGSSG
jgi:hypothetical protein